MLFLCGKPLTHLVMLRLLMEPLRVYMHKQFSRAADVWEYEQRANLAAAQSQGVHYVRKFRVTEVAKGDDDKRFVMKLELLAREVDLWTMTPPSGCTVTLRAVAFRCIARMGLRAPQAPRESAPGLPHASVPRVVERQFRAGSGGREGMLA